jgi:hypothetical protein
MNNRSEYGRTQWLRRGDTVEVQRYVVASGEPHEADSKGARGQRASKSRYNSPCAPP